jgi:biotin carboxylase
MHRLSSGRCGAEDCALAPGRWMLDGSHAIQWRGSGEWLCWWSSERRANPEELLARYDQTLVDAVSTAPARPEAHYCVATDSGMMIVDVWASRADLQRAVIENEDFQAKWRAAGWPEETFEVFELHNSGWPA